MRKKAVLALSGGMDSTTVLAWLAAQGYEVECFGFNYGSKHNPYELSGAERIAKHYKVPFTELNLREGFQFMTSNLMAGQGEIPEGHYEDKSMEQTVVPGRNIIFLSYLAGLAWSREAQHIAIGIHQGDHAIYADCRKSFFDKMNDAIVEGTDGRVGILAPFVNGDKGDIVSYGLEASVPYHLTRTCYKAQRVSCGKCGSCRERLEAFEANRAKDPIPYV